MNFNLDISVGRKYSLGEIVCVIVDHPSGTSERVYTKDSIGIVVGIDVFKDDTVYKVADEFSTYYYTADEIRLATEAEKDNKLYRIVCTRNSDESVHDLGLNII